MQGGVRSSRTSTASLHWKHLPLDHFARLIAYCVAALTYKCMIAYIASDIHDHHCLQYPALHRAFGRKSHRQLRNVYSMAMMQGTFP